MSLQSNENPSPPHRPVPMQLQPDIKYTIWTNSRDRQRLVLADVFVLSPSNTVFLQGGDPLTGGPNGTEFWFITNDSGILGSFESADEIHIDVAQIISKSNSDFDPTNRTRYEFGSVDDRGPWSTTPATYSANSNETILSRFFWNTRPDGTADARGVQLVILTAAVGGTKSLHGIQWCQYRPNSPPTTHTMEVSGDLSVPDPPVSYTRPGYYYSQSM